MSANRVEEITGIYGPIFFAEKQIQRIWANKSFRFQGLTTRSGKRLEVLDPGRWNFQEGPDFREAILEIDGKRRHGDIEIHLHERDWLRHDHGEDPNFSNVVLHVVLFPDRRAGSAPNDESMETLEWLKYLDRDLETYFEDQGVDQLLDEGLPDVLRGLLDYPVEMRERVLVRAASERWIRKRDLCRKRIALEGLPETVHQMMLETLGLKRNRATMSRLAITFPRSHWQKDPSGVAAAGFEAFRGDWKLAGTRPANHPARRLQAYGDWSFEKRGQGVEALVTNSLPGGKRSEIRASRVGRWRKEMEIARREKEWRAAFSPALVGTRFHTWVGDGLLPLMGASAGAGDCFPLWFVWPVGDLPEQMKKALKTLEIIGPGRPLCHGWTQGIIRMLEPDYCEPNE